MQQSTSRPAATPLRVVLVALLLAGFGMWQAWQCTDGMSASPMVGIHAVTAVSPQADHLGQATAVPEDTSDQPGMPTGLAGLCMSVLAAVAAAFLLMTSPLRLLALLRRLGSLLARPVPVMPRTVTLAQLCVSRT